jgi:hypothetical protein
MADLVMVVIMAIMAINSIIITDIANNITDHTVRNIGKIIIIKTMTIVPGIKIMIDMINAMIATTIATAAMTIIIVIMTVIGTTIITKIGAGKTAQT